LKLIALFIIVTVGCGGSKQLIVEEKSRETGPPAWINQQTTHPEYLYFVGIVDQAKSLREGRDQALQDAANQASSYIGIRISSDTFIQDSTQQTGTFVSEQTQSSTNASISYLEKMDEYYVKTSRTAGNYYEEKYTVYVLTRFPKESAQKEKERQAEAAKRDGGLALSFYEDALVHLNKRQPMEAFEKISQAQDLLKGLSDGVALNHAEIKNTELLSSAVNLKRQMLEKRSRTIKLESSTPYAAEFRGAFVKAVANHGFELNPAQENAARFKLTVTINIREGKEIWNQSQYIADYSYAINDHWTANTITGDSGEAKAFAVSKEVAAKNAVAEAATEIGQLAGMQLEAYLSQNE
jgi:hypothetical protein